jgi:hypothetical protein
MKLRMGFVSNSSSCSFTIPVKGLSQELISNILNPVPKALEIGHTRAGDPDYFSGWSIHMIGDKKAITGFTIMDNFGMTEYLEKLGLDLNKIDIDDDNW